MVLSRITTNITMKTIIYISGIFLLLNSCNQLESPEPIVGQNLKPKLGDLLRKSEAINYKIEYNLKYGEYNLQAYDLYRPVLTVDSIPSILLVTIHGGGWGLLDKSFLDPFVDRFKSKKLNLTIMNINHRLVEEGKITFDNIMDDLDVLMNHIESRKEELRLNGEILLFGYSSGGHIAMSYAYNHPEITNIKAVSAVVAPTDLTLEDVRKNIFSQNKGNLTEILVGKKYSEDPVAFKEASPFYKISKSTTPTVLFYSGQDEILEEIHGKKTYDALKNKKVETSFYLYPSENHEMKSAYNDIIDKSIAFYAER